MKSRHDEMEELLPAYVKDSLFPEGVKAVEAHLEECKECRDAAEVLSGLLAVDVPDPGQAFWESLPRRVRLGARGKRKLHFSIRSLFLTYLPLAVAACAVLIAFSVHRQAGPNRTEPVPGNTLAVGPADYAKELREAVGCLPDRVYHGPDYGYNAQLSSLNQNEIERLNEALEGIEARRSSSQ